MPMAMATALQVNFDKVVEIKVTNILTVRRVGDVFMSGLLSA